MSETGKEVTPATKANCERWRRTRRYQRFDWPGVGEVVLQSAMAGEWIKIDAARTRARMAAVSGNVKLHEQATQDFLLAVCHGLVLDLEHAPFFTSGDRELILEMDSAITDPLVVECMNHCDLAAIDLGAAQKN